LIVVRFALLSITTGTFVLQRAVTQFLWVSIAGVAIGIALAHGVYALHRALKLSPPVDTALTLLTPYLLYLLAEQAHASGVLAVVAGGLYLSSRAERFLSARSRVVATGTWSTVVFALNGVVFILIGLQLRAVTAQLGALSLVQATGIGAFVALVAVLARVAWTFPAAYLPSFLPWKPRPRRFPDWKMVSLVSWAGMRGVVSLAAALALPATLPNGAPFPHRGLIVYVTFIVILLTLVAQGSSLPWLVRKLRFDLPDDAHERRRKLDAHLAAHVAKTDVAHCADEDAVKREHILAQRVELLRMRNAGEIPYPLARAIEHELDLDIARLDARLEALHAHH
jgi:CPA1 family monovalent cation:H+ antiporter